MLNICKHNTCDSMLLVQCCLVYCVYKWWAKVNCKSSYYSSFLTLYTDLTTCTMGDVALALRLCGIVRHVAAKMTQLAPHSTVCERRLTAACSLDELLMDNWDPYTTQRPPATAASAAPGKWICFHVLRLTWPSIITIRERLILLRISRRISHTFPVYAVRLY